MHSGVDHNRITMRLRHTPAAILLVLIILLVGCASKGERGLFSRFGDSVMDTVGATPPKEEFAQGEAIVNATEAFSREEEYYLGRAVAARILSKFAPVNSPSAQEYLETLGRALAVYSEQPQTFGGYHFTIIDTDSINAISAPGGFVFVSRGMIERIDQEDTLSAVLAHEIVHVTRQHGIRSISRDSLNGVLESAGLLMGSVSCDVVLQQAALVFGATVDEIVDTLLEKGYSREFEYEADRGAIDILNRAGLSDQALQQVLALLDASGQVSGGWLSTHPDTEDRRSKIAGAVPQLLGSAENDLQQAFLAIRNRRFTKFRETF